MFPEAREELPTTEECVVADEMSWRTSGLKERLYQNDDDNLTSGSESNARCKRESLAENNDTNGAYSFACP